MYYDKVFLGSNLKLSYTWLYKGEVEVTGCFLASDEFLFRGC